MFFLKEITSAEEAKGVTHLTYKSYGPVLDRSDQESWVVAIAAYNIKKLPIGLVLGEISKDNKLGIYTLYVIPKYRRLGVALALMSEIEKVALRKGVCGIVFGCPDYHEDFQTFDRLLVKAGWQERLSPVMYIYKASMKNLSEEQAPYFTWLTLPEGLKSSPFDDLKEAEKRELVKQEGVDYPYWISPFAEGGRIEKLNSLVLRNNEDEILGWVITRRLDTETILYRSVYIREEMRSFGYIMILLGEAINLQYEAGIYNLMFAVHIKHQPMLKIVKKFMKTFDYYTSVRFQTEKSLVRDSEIPFS